MAGPIFIPVAMALFAFTTLLGNLYYTRNAIAFLNKKKFPGKPAMAAFHIFCILVIFFGAIMPMDACWALADITMGAMTLINLPAFIARHIKLDPTELDYWKHKEKDESL